MPQAQAHPGYPYPAQHPSDQPRTEPPRRPVETRYQDTATYDLGSYGLPTQPAAPSPPAPPPAAGWDMRTVAPQQRQWQPQAQPQPVQPQTDPFGYAPAATPHQPQLQAHPGYPQPAGMVPPAMAHAPAQYAEEQQPEYEDDVELEDAPRPRRRWMIAAALVGAIGVGSAMAYAYKTIVGPQQVAGKQDQVVRASREPVKVAPAERGGKQFANSDARVLNNRVPSEGSAAASGGPFESSGTVDSNGVRHVATVAVGPGGSAPSAVPGMMVVNPTIGAGGLPPAMAEPPLPPSAPIAAAPPPPPVRPAPAVQPSPPPRVAAPAPRPPVSDPPPARVAAVAPKPPAPDRPKAVGGVVAVLGYQKSQIEAMKMMADLQQKYEVLRNKRLEVVQSDQTSRGLGVIYRVVVGPRGNLSDARKVCTDLFAAGMGKQGCYPLGQ